MTTKNLMKLEAALLAAGYEEDAVLDALQTVDAKDSSTVIAKALMGHGIMPNDSLDTVTNYVATATTTTPEILAWNTGRPYTAQGQRIAAIAIGNGVFMSDQDRGIAYYLPDATL